MNTPDSLILNDSTEMTDKAKNNAQTAIDR